MSPFSSPDENKCDEIRFLHFKEFDESDESVTKYRLDEEDIELENSNNYDDNSSDYDPLELVQELINENLSSEIVNKGAFQLSVNNQRLLDDFTNSEESPETNNNKCEEVLILHTKTNIQLNNIIWDVKKFVQ